MRKIHSPVRTLVSAAVLSVMSTSAAYAGAFSLYTEGSALMVGNYAAGAAAEAADASTGWYNPAGLALIHNTQAVTGGVGVFPEAKLAGTSTYTVTGLPNYVERFDGVEGGKNAFVPSFHYALPLGENATFGLSMVAPFGLATDWDDQSPVRYEATFTELITTNISPEIGGKLTENFALGAGLDVQFSRVKFNRMIGAPNLATALGRSPYFFDSQSYNKGQSWGTGFHVGAMGMFNDNHTRVGLNYQSRMRHTFYGSSQLSGRLATAGGNVFNAGLASTASESSALFSNPIDFPDILTISAYHDVNDTIAVLGSVVWTGWDVFKEIRLNNVIAPSVSGGGVISNVIVNSTSAQNYSDAWRAALAVNYKYSPQWLFRLGGGYDQTPTNDEYRDVRLPDSDRWALSVGAHYQMNDKFGFDFGYTHLFADDSPINKTERLNATSTYNVNVIGTAHVDLVGLQVNWNMDQPMPMPTK